jgi:hypothetical protein
MKKVLIAEVGGSHIECVYSFAHFLHEKNCEIHLVCNEKIGHLFPEKNKLAALLTIPDEMTAGAQLKHLWRIRKYILRNKIDTIIINTTEVTVVRNLIFFLPKINAVGLVHNAKKLENSFTFSKIISRRIKKFLVLGNYLLQNINPLAQFKVAAFFPVYFPRVHKLEVVKPKEQFWITVPGGVEVSRRDYEPFLQMLLQNDLPENIVFVFLGFLNPLDNIYKLLKESGLMKSRIITFEQYLDYELFHSYIVQTNAILPLIKINNNDFYSDKRISGSFNLAMGYKLPLLLPLEYSSNNDLKPFSFYYENMEELKTLLLQLFESPEKSAEIKYAYENNEMLNPHLLADKLYNFISS